ncbi:flavin-containing monooxygenase [Parasphingorhabdus cellanae]|uniref:NAD(P)/FAD-dependent oxidoreductase n=1 Tax=Parasphingorhabdus cellanae TaxID=2806553 RepID=A0ABX7T3M5_9SPHN|nr:NAD(P)/FAD-dependent oxidoreductase [Parasphingorhabdus cellanae]QTD55402.1 NAD(P)/FAD-dependent oxidoreductase [Parasphingorhabdus cellanae]
MADTNPGDLDVHLWTARFAALLAKADGVSASTLFAKQAAWRDLLAFTWTIKTFEGRNAIGDLLRTKLTNIDPTNWAVEAEPDADEGWLSFETRFVPCKGYVRLENGQALTFFTALQDLHDHEEPSGKRRPSGLYDDDGDKEGGTRNWRDRQRNEQASLGRDRQPYVLIVGGGQGGLALGARLKVNNVPSLIVDRHDRAGDAWRTRYKSLTLHDPVWYDHMPYIPFPDSWPIYTPKDKLGDFLEAYAKIMDLNIWNGTEFTAASYDEESKRWNVTVERDGVPLQLQPTHIVMAVGNAGFPRKPDFPGASDFTGEQYHSSEYTSGEEFAGKRVVVIGANNSAHDICADLVNHGIQPTMIQRSSTLVLRGSTNSKMARPLYSEEAVEQGLTTDRADFLNASMPMRMSEQAQKQIWTQVAKSDADFYASLTNAGFQLDFGEDGTGLFMKYLRTASGYYIDVGAAAMVADGRIALKSGVEVERLTDTALVLSDGSELTADAIIYATGFGSMEQWVERLISPEVAKKIGPCWGYGSGTTGDPGPWEGEIRNMWKPTAQEGLWFHGGNLQQSRFYSRYLALQLNARFKNVEIAI